MESWFCRGYWDDEGITFAVGPAQLTHEDPSHIPAGGDQPGAFRPSELDGLADRNFAYWVGTLTSNPWASADHMMSDKCGFEAAVSIDGRSDQPLSARHLSRLLLLRLLLKPPSAVLGKAISGRLVTWDASGSGCRMADDWECLLPTSNGRHLRQQILRCQQVAVPAALFPAVGSLLPEHALVIQPAMRRSPALTLEPARTTRRIIKGSCRSVTRRDLFRSSPRVVATGLVSTFTFAAYRSGGRIHRLLLDVPAYRNWWFASGQKKWGRFRHTARERTGSGNPWLSRRLKRQVAREIERLTDCPRTA